MPKLRYELEVIYIKNDIQNDIQTARDSLISWISIVPHEEPKQTKIWLGFKESSEFFILNVGQALYFVQHSELISNQARIKILDNLPKLKECNNLQRHQNAVEIQLEPIFEGQICLNENLLEGYIHLDGIYYPKLYVFENNLP